MISGSIQAALAAATRELAATGVPDPGRDARLLMAAALGLETGRLMLVSAEPLGPAPAAAFAGYIAARARRQPVAQILGRRTFWGRDFAVTRDVLDPRPETETLIACALDGPPPRSLIDLGTGSGAILVTLLCEWPAAQGIGTDTSAAALAVAARNAERHGVAGRAVFRAADWTEGIAERFDLVVCNPPYIPEGQVGGLAPDVREWEPRAALTAGPTGLEAYRRLAAGLGRTLHPGGRALFEIGAEQGAAAAAIFRAAGFARVVVHSDLDERDRVLAVLAD